MRVLIPAYREPEQLAKTTLAYLERSVIDSAEVTILVPDEQDWSDHAATIEAKWADRLLVSAPGLGASRQWALEHLLPVEGEEVIWINDDVRFLAHRIDDTTTEWVPLGEVAAAGFAAARHAGAGLWGVYPLTNARWMKEKTRTDLRHIVGCFYGEIVSHDPRLRPRFGDAKEDYERSLRRYDRDGAVVRLDYYGVDTTYYNRRRGEPIGGRFGAARTPETVEENVRKLIEEWPAWVHRNERRQSPFPEILLRAPKQAPLVARI